jgi:hypothetical protein
MTILPQSNLSFVLTVSTRVFSRMHNPHVEFITCKGVATGAIR